MYLFTTPDIFFTVYKITTHAGIVIDRHDLYCLIYNNEHW